MYYQQRPPGKGSAGIVIAVISGFVALCMFFAWLFASYNGYGVSLICSLFLAAGIAGMVFGVAKQLEKKLPIAVHGGILGGLTILFTALGPTISTGIEVSKEERLYEELSQENANAPDWIFKYEKQVPSQFRREDWKLQWMKARVRQGKRGKDALELRNVANECDTIDEKDLVEPAKEEAIKALKELYDAGKQKMYGPAAGGTREFAIDPKLRDAFGVALDQLSKSKDPNLYVFFKNSADLSEPAQMAEALKLQKADPQVTSVFPKGNIPIIDKGGAFDAAYDKRRRATFITAMGESFKQVFDGNLITLVPLEDNDRKKKIVLEVSSQIYRVPEYFVYTEAEKAAGLLFSFSVKWNFALYGNDGKLLYKVPQEAISSPTDARFTSEPTDPKWAPYSIMMDSAYFNYSREVTGRLGFTPPAPKAVFAYQP